MIALIILSLVYLCRSQCTSKCYYTNETLTAGGPWTCIDDCDCWSIRTCSGYGWCQGTDTYHDPPDCATTTTISPTPIPTKVPSHSPTKYPTRYPTQNPTKGPTLSPTKNPTTKQPTPNPSSSPTNNPLQSPTSNPSRSPTQNPTRSPTQNPTRSPTQNPTRSPTQNPTRSPTKHPILSTTSNPTSDPTKSPTWAPTIYPSQTTTTSYSEQQPEYESTNNDYDVDTGNDVPHKPKTPNVFSNGFLLSRWYLLVGGALTFFCLLCIFAACCRCVYKIEMKRKQSKRSVASMSHTNNNDIELEQPTSKSLTATMMTSMGLMQIMQQQYPNNMNVNIPSVNIPNKMTDGEIIRIHGNNRTGIDITECSADDVYEEYDAEGLYSSEPNKNGNEQVTPQ